MSGLGRSVSFGGERALILRSEVGSFFIAARLGMVSCLLHAFFATPLDGARS